MVMFQFAMLVYQSVNGGFHGHGGIPKHGWFISGKIHFDIKNHETGRWLGVALFQETSIWAFPVKSNLESTDQSLAQLFDAFCVGFFLSPLLQKQQDQLDKGPLFCCLVAVCQCLWFFKWVQPPIFNWIQKRRDEDQNQNRYLSHGPSSRAPRVSSSRFPGRKSLGWSGS